MGGSFGDPARRRVGLRGADGAYVRPDASVCADCRKAIRFLPGIGGRPHAGDPRAEREIAFGRHRANRDAVGVDAESF